MTKRTFLGVKITPTERLLNAFEEIKNELKDEKIKWTDIQNMHITLRFIGDTTTKEIGKISTDIEQLSEKFNKFSLKISEFGVFSNIFKPRVLWFGVSEKENLELLHFAVNNVADTHISRKNDNTFNAHLTIGRVKSTVKSKIISNLTDKYSNEILQTVLVDKIYFYESILTKQGSIYKPIKIFRLK